MIEERIIYFNEELHKYTDQFGNAYTSATTKLDQYAPKKDFVGIAKACERAGKNPMHRNYLKYRGKTYKQLLKEWGHITDVSLVRGNKEHNYLEDTVKIANGFKTRYKSKKPLHSNRAYMNMYSVYDLATGELDDIGNVTIDTLKAEHLHIKYPDVFSLIVTLSKKGYKFYPEIVVYHPDLLIAGMIDLLAVKGKEFIIIDWKTNKGDIRFEAGYYLKDDDGNMLDEFKLTGETYKYPISHLPYSVGYKYSLQLSLYAAFVERFGYTCKGLILVHITHDVISVEACETWRTQFLKIEYLKQEIERISDDILLSGDNRNNQYNVFK